MVRGVFQNTRACHGHTDRANRSSTLRVPIDGIVGNSNLEIATDS